MDLKSILRDSDNGEHPPPASLAAAPGPPKQKHPPAPSPATPVGAAPPYGYRDYPQPAQASPGRPGPPSRDYAHPAPPPQGQYLPPSPYQTPVPYANRQSVSAVQPSPYNDVRSPSGAPVPVPGPSPYRQPSVGAPNYPFSQTQPPSQEVTSPAQRHQPQFPPREYPPQPGPPAAAVGPHSGSYIQQHPLTQPVGPPGGAHPYLHQRSQSTHSTPTPTSAHSQHQYGPAPFIQSSPVAAHHPLPREYNRQQSLPLTPQGQPPSAGPRPAGSFAQPPSPQQQRLSSTSVAHLQQVQASPPPPPPIPQIPNTHSHADIHAAESHRRSGSQSERGKSVSVSPRTRVPSLPSASSIHHGSIAESEHRPSATMAAEVERAVTPAKRKLEDRDLPLDEMERKEARPPPGQVNGGHVPPPFQRASTSPVLQRKKRVRHRDPPIWSELADHCTLGRSANFVLQKHHRLPAINGKHDGVNRLSRNTSPEAARTTGPSHVPEPPLRPESLLGPWEQTITAVKPYEEISKNVADFLFVNVVGHPDSGEIQSRGIQFEIEAKLGTLIDKDTNLRVDRKVASECLLQDTGRVAFKSSMTEAQHQALNGFLNDVVVNTDPRNPKTGSSRVQVQYLHRREVDKYFDIPPALQDRIPICVRSQFAKNHTVKVRVTYDQKSGQILAKLVKARVGDIDIHMPKWPLDCRISVNLEMTWDGPVEELEGVAGYSGEKFPDRQKDRLSYTQSHYQIDLTQVTQTYLGPNNTQRVDKEHELEIELSPTMLIKQGKRAEAGEPHMYTELVEGFIDNVRLLARQTLQRD